MSSQSDLSGKVYVVTGANSGIGFHAAREFASRGASLVLVCRSREKGERARNEIITVSGNSRVKLYLADFSSLSSVSKLADELLADYPEIDVLCNNAGGANNIRTETAELFETTFVTNHLAGFLLTIKLLPAILKAAESNLARIVFTSSYGHSHSALDFNDLGLKKNYSTLKAYGRSKLMNLLTAREIQRHYGNKNIAISSFHPGTVRTPIWEKGGSLARILGWLMYPFMVSIEKGADTFIWLASSGEEGSVSAGGNYFYQRKQPRIAEFATDEAAEKLWKLSNDLVKSYL